MANTGAQLGQSYQTYMPAFSDNADIQQAFMMLWYGDPNATGPTSRGVEAYLAKLNSDILSVGSRKTTDVIFSATAPTRNTDGYSDWIWVDTSKTNPDGASRPVNIWNGSAWSEIAGAADPAANYNWTGQHTFANMSIKTPINSFATAAARNTALAGAPDGTMSYVNGVYEYLKSGSWTKLIPDPPSIDAKTLLPAGGTINQTLAKASNDDHIVKWLSVVPQSGGDFTGPVTIPDLTAPNITSGSINVPSGNLRLGSRRLYIQAAQPTGMATGDVWIQA